MIYLNQSLLAWGSPAFLTTLKTELEHLSKEALLLQQGLSHSSHVAETPHTALILSTTESENVIQVRCGICYAGVIGGCQCADDPTPLNENPEYCELAMEIDKATGAASIRLLLD